MFDHKSSSSPVPGDRDMSRAEVEQIAQETRSSANQAMTAAARCGDVAHQLGSRLRHAASFLARRSTRQLSLDTPVVTALATGHTALVAAQAAAEDATSAAADAAEAAMAIELELEFLPDA